jgi:metal-responsive CopG/Arc/MetJ family transcriptional regulator
MHSLEKLKSKQIGFRMPIYLIEEIDELTRYSDVNRSAFIIEAVKKALKEHKESNLY